MYQISKKINGKTKNQNGNQRVYQKIYSNTKLIQKSIGNVYIKYPAIKNEAVDICAITQLIQQILRGREVI